MKKTLPPPPTVIEAYPQPGNNLTPDGLENLREEQKRAEDQQRINAIKAHAHNKVAELMDETIYVQEWTHPCLFHSILQRQLSVTEFYPNSRVAVDKFTRFDKLELEFTKFKRSALNAAGYRYICLTPDKDWADALADLESQNVIIPTAA